MYHDKVQTPASLSLSKVLQATENITNWYPLGVVLSINAHDLEYIRNNCQNIGQRCKRDVLSVWLQRDNRASWEKLVTALYYLDNNDLAYNILQTIVMVSLRIIKLNSKYIMLPNGIILKMPV